MRLPFGFTTVEPETTAAGLCDALGAPRVLALRARLADLDDEFTRLVASVTERVTQDALRALERKLGVLEEMLMADLPEPASAELEMSADGIGFEASDPLEAGSWIAVHLVLPVNYHLLAAARVQRSVPVDQHAGKFRIGAAFERLEPLTARRLTRFVIGRDAPAD